MEISAEHSDGTMIENVKSDNQTLAQSLPEHHVSCDLQPLECSNDESTVNNGIDVRSQSPPTTNTSNSYDANLLSFAGSTNVYPHHGHYTERRPPELVHPALWVRKPKKTQRMDQILSHHRALNAGCVFCRVAASIEPANILFRDDEFMVITDIRPAATYHLLVLPIEHLPDPKSLLSVHSSTVRAMEKLGKRVLDNQGAPLSDMRLGFHWPPFHSIEHLHMHCLAPVSNMGFFNKMVHYRPDSWAFVTSEWLINHLESGT
jgi:diadenosine tetraphosphate (Ap4A) HIT family hydrolase